MIDYFKMALTEKYAQFNGRSTRSEFWYFMLASYLILIVLGLVMGLVAYLTGDTSGIFWVFFGLFCIFGLALMIPMIAISIRRLHDSGRSGWWYLACMIPYIGTVIYIVLMCLDTEAGTNQYGPNPFELHSGDDISGHLVEDDLV